MCVWQCLNVFLDDLALVLTAGGNYHKAKNELQ